RIVRSISVRSEFQTFRTAAWHSDRSVWTFSVDVALGACTTMYRSGSVLGARLFPVPRTRRVTRAPLATDSTSEVDTPAWVAHPEHARIKTAQTRLERHTISLHGQSPPFRNASHAARCVACQGVRSQPVPVALVGECSVPVV